MRHQWLLVWIGAVLSGPAMADLYKCQVNGRQVYQDTPCPGATVKVIPRAALPAPAQVPGANALPPETHDQSRARMQAREDVRRARQIDAQRDHELRMEAMRRDAEAAAEARRVADCRVAEVEVKRQEADALAHPRDEWWQNRARAERERFRLRCW